MKNYSLTVLFGFLFLTSFAEEKGWVSLFNGKNLDGWKVLNGTATYVISGDEIIGTSKMGSPNSFLATTALYSDFILEYDMKMASGLNSGVQIRSISDPAINNGRVHGYQVECDDSERGWSAGIYDEARRGWLYPMEYNPAGKKSYKKADWNHFRIEAVGSSIRTWLNGVPCANLIDEMTPTGFIALQVHGIGSNKENEGKTISWRNVRIKTTQLAKSQTKMDAGVPEVSYLNNKLTDIEKKAGWKLLWNGKDMEGWINAKDGKAVAKGWTIENNSATVNKPENKSEGDIVTDKDYKNFILEVDFNFTPGGNSGIKYFIQPNKNGVGYSNVGCEYQVLDDEKHPDAKLGINGNRTVGSLYDMIPADASKFDPSQGKKRVNGPNQWNRARIEVKGKDVTHYLNGLKVVQYTRGSDEWKKAFATSKFTEKKGFGEFPTGRILLQSHNDQVSFKNIKIKEL